MTQHRREGAGVMGELKPVQRDLLRHIADLLAPFAPGDTGYQVLTPDELFALLSLCAELGGELYRVHHGSSAFCSHSNKECLDWDDARWAEEWRKREGL